MSGLLRMRQGRDARCRHGMSRGVCGFFPIAAEWRRASDLEADPETAPVAAAHINRRGNIVHDLARIAFVGLQQEGIAMRSCGCS